MVYEIIIGVFTAGAAWGGSQAALNGTRSRVKKLEEWSERHEAKDDNFQLDAIDRLARIETKLDVLTEK